MTATTCCSSHSPVNCCDPDDCGPCCSKCPTCPTLARGIVPEPRREVVRGFRGPEACAIAGITYRQLDYWARTELVAPSVRAAAGSGTQRLYSRRDVAALKLSRSMLDAGLSLQCVRSLLPDLLAAYDGRRLRHAQLDERGYVTLDCGDVAIRVDIAAAITAVPDPPIVSVDAASELRVV